MPRPTNNQTTDLTMTNHTIKKMRECSNNGYYCYDCPFKDECREATWICTECEKLTNYRAAFKKTFGRR